MAKVYKRGSVWWMEYTDHLGARHRRSASADRSVAQKMLGDALDAAEKMRGGMLLADPAQGKRPMREHLGEYLADMQRRGRDGMYVYNIRKRIERAIEKQGWDRLTDATADGVRVYLNTLSTLAEKTRNDHRADLAGFFGWCVKCGRIGVNPCASVDKTKVPKVKKRRALAARECVALIQAAPPDRALVYLMLAYTGLRRAEAAALVWSYLRLDGMTPFVELPATITKSGQPENIPLVSALASALRAARGDRDGGEPVFPTMPTMAKFRADLAAAKIDERDERGRVVVLHSLRHSLATMLAGAGVPMAVAQRIMRHRDIRLTAETYTDEALLPMAAAMLALPALAMETAAPMMLAATGTDCVKNVPNTGPVGAQTGMERGNGSAVKSAQLVVRTQLGTPGHSHRKAAKTGVLGFEPRLSESESLVLPLHHTPNVRGIVRPGTHRDK